MKIVPSIRLVGVIALVFGMGSSVLGDEIADLQGTWEMVQTYNGVEQRVVKTIEDRTETVEVFLDGVLTQKHVVDISIEVFGPVRVFHWRNGQITEGPNKGRKLPDGRSILRLEDQTWVAVHGMLRDDKTSVTVEVFKRPPPAPSA